MKSGPLCLLTKHRAMLCRTTWNEIKARYAGSILGLAWLVFYPLLFLGVYSVFIYILMGKRAGDLSDPALIDQVLLVFCGLIPFIGFAEGLAGGVVSVTQNANLIKNTLFPIELVPVKAVLVGQCTQVVGTAMLLVCLAVFGKLTIWVLVLPLVWLLQIALSVGVAWILSSLNVYFRDLQNIVGVVTLMLMLISPIAWKAVDIPASVLPWMMFNPLYYVIVACQQCLLLGRFPDPILLEVLGVLAVLVFFGGYAFFRRMKRVFADNV
ncbi:ABC transporter permease [Candidatus Sumerlaeota bacterium]|nr:ABC transporter permease [Candidatus Sumerlaeota bacterium]